MHHIMYKSVAFTSGHFSCTQSHVGMTSPYYSKHCKCIQWHSLIVWIFTHSDSCSTAVMSLNSLQAHFEPAASHISDPAHNHLKNTQSPQNVNSVDCNYLEDHKQGYSYTPCTLFIIKLILPSEAICIVMYALVSIRRA